MLFFLKTSIIRTFLSRVDHIEDLTDSVFDRDAVNVEFLQSLENFLVEVDQLKERQHSIAVNVQAAEPVLYADW